MKQPLISVIIPTKNEEKVIGACLLALTKQKTAISFEILIVDTNSKDRTRAIAKQYNTRIIKEPRPGWSFAHQAGADAARGSILCFTEADCIVPPTWIEQYANAFQTHDDTDAFVGRYVYHKSTPFLTHVSTWLMPVADTAFRLIHGHYAFRASNFAIRASALQKVGGFNLRAKEFDDVELSMRVAKCGKIKYLPPLIIRTGDRRVRGRLLRYVKEVGTNYIRTCILKQAVSDKVFADIR